MSAPTARSGYDHLRIAVVVLDESRSGRSPSRARPALPAWVVGLVLRLIRDHDVTVITDLDDSALPDVTALNRRWISGALQRRVLPRPRSGDPRSENVVRSLADAIGSIQADVVHAVGTVAGRVVESLGWDAPAPLVWSAGEQTSRSGRGVQIAPWIPRRAEAVIASTSRERDELVAQGVPRDRIHVAPLRVWPPMAELTQPIGTRVRVRRVCCLLDSDPVGVDAMVRALVNLPEMRLLVVGRSTTEGTVAAARHVALLARNLHVDGRVSVLAEASGRSLELAMRGADVVALLSPERPDLPALGAALVSGGVPVVLGGTGAEEIVEHGVSGVCLRSLDARSLTSTLRILDRDPDVRNTMAVAARRRARELYDTDSLAASCVEAYRSAHWHRIPVVLPARPEHDGPEGVSSGGRGVAPTHV
jgi:glycosyltransferase involved in cell wall biosynthesis